MLCVSARGRPIQVEDVEAGKTALSRLIESVSGYVFVDGDAVSKRVNH